MVEGMSGSPVYIGNKLLGALAYRIGQFSKEPIAGITPIEQMLEVRDIAAGDATAAGAEQACCQARVWLRCRATTRARFSPRRR